MEVYELTDIGKKMAHSPSAPNKPEWAVIYFLSKHGSATKDQILAYVPSADSGTLAKLKRIRVIENKARGFYNVGI